MTTVLYVFTNFNDFVAMLRHVLSRKRVNGLTCAGLPQMREEQREVVARHGPALTRAALADMRWADAMAHEVLRLRGPAEGLWRCARRATLASSIESALVLPQGYPRPHPWRASGAVDLQGIYWHPGPVHCPNVAKETL